VKGIFGGEKRGKGEKKRPPKKKIASKARCRGKKERGETLFFSARVQRKVEESLNTQEKWKKSRVKARYSRKEEKKGKGKF